MLEQITNNQYHAFTKQENAILLAATSWCGPCWSLCQYLDLAQDAYDVPMAVADMDTNHSNLKRAITIEAVPSLIFYQGGEVIEIVEGLQYKDPKELFEKIEGVYGITPIRPSFQQ